MLNRATGSSRRKSRSTVPALLKDGSVKEVVVAKLLGDEVAKKVGPVWGFGADGEMTMLIHPKLSFSPGSGHCITPSRPVPDSVM